MDGHPDPGAATLCGALAIAYAEGAGTTGHEVRRIHVGGLQFPILRKSADFMTEPQEPDMTAARDAILWADHLVFVYPLWLGAAPALLKAFLEQVARANFVLAPGTGFPKGKLKGRSARVIVTMGMPAILYRVIYGASGVRAFNRSILGLAGIAPIRTTLLGGITPDRSQEKLVAKVREIGRRAA
jgi:putative NADPH-quinone reductase